MDIAAKLAILVNLNEFEARKEGIGVDLCEIWFSSSI
jgi:hypothetical protein